MRLVHTQKKNPVALLTTAYIISCMCMYFFFFFHWHYNPLGVLAFSVILFHSALSLHCFLHSFIPIICISSSLSTIYLFLGLPLILAPISSHTIIFLGVLLSSICITWPSQTLLLFINLTISAFSINSECACYMHKKRLKKLYELINKLQQMPSIHLSSHKHYYVSKLCLSFKWLWIFLLPTPMWSSTIRFSHDNWKVEYHHKVPLTFILIMLI
jgi:hypothetical protein